MPRVPKGTPQPRKDAQVERNKLPLPAGATAWVSYSDPDILMSDTQKAVFLKCKELHMGDATACLHVGVSLHTLKVSCNDDPHFGHMVATYRNKPAVDCLEVMHQVVTNTDIPALVRFDYANKLMQVDSDIKHRKRALTIQEKAVQAKLTAIQNTVNVTVGDDNRKVTVNPAALTDHELEEYNKLYSRITAGGALTDIEMRSYISYQQKLLIAKQQIAAANQTRDESLFTDPGPDDTVDEIYRKTSLKSLNMNGLGKLPGTNGSGHSGASNGNDLIKDLEDNGEIPK